MIDMVVLVFSAICKIKFNGNKIDANLLIHINRQVLIM